MKKVTNSLNISAPQGSFVDEGDGVVSFPNGLTITDGTVQRNGTTYDIDSLDISKYGGQLTGDHEDKLSNLIGETIGTVKKDGKVVVNKIRYAVKENPYARLAYDLLVGGFSKNFSTETIGPKPDHNGIWYDSELIGLSQVVTQNNYSATVNKVIHNSLERAKEDGLDVEGIEEKIVNSVEEDKNNTMDEDKDKKVVVEDTNVDSTKVTAPEVTETKEVEAPEAEEVKEVKTPENKEAEKQNNESDKTEKTENKVDKTEVEEEVVEEDKKETTQKEEKMEDDKKSTVEANAIADAIKNALAPFSARFDALEEAQKNQFDASAEEPKFKKDESKEVAKNDYKNMDWQDRYQEQINAAWNYVKTGSITAGETLREINSVNLDALKEAGIARNAISLEELGNFVIAPEMYNEIQGHRNDYTAILNATEWKETLSLEFAWLQRVGDIDMQPVGLNATDADPDANLKPISEYSAVPKKSELEELAAVTVVATSATRFAAVDLLADAAAGYRNDYDRKRAQLVIAKLEQAVDETGYSTGYAPASDVDALTAWLEAVTDISDTTLNGTLIFNARTFAELKSRALKAGANGPLSEILTTGDMPTVFGYRFVIVPNDLMPSLGGSETIAHVVEGETVTINHAVFFADLSTFTGRTSGGLQYDVSNSAPYEVGGVVKSAYQRNELVLRGSFFRGGAVKDVQVVSGVRQSGAANVS